MDKNLRLIRGEPMYNEDKTTDTGGKPTEADKTLTNSKKYSKT